MPAACSISVSVPQRVWNVVPMSRASALHTALSSKSQDSGLSSRGIRVRIPSGRPFSLRKRRFSIRDRSPLRPIGSTRSQPAAQVRQGPSLFMRSWRKSNAPVCQSGVGSASLPERTIWSCGVNSQHSGLLIRTVRVQLPPAPPNLLVRGH